MALLTPGTASVRHHQLGFWLIAVTFALTMAFSTVPTPLYPLYQRQDRFGAFVVTIVFATYAVGALVALFLAGHLSDWFGRKRVLLPAILLSVASALVFICWTSVPALIVARLASGLSVGLRTATATAHLDDLHRQARPGSSGVRANVVATAANLGGLGLGSLLSGLLAEHTVTPLRTPYLVFLGLLILGVVAVLMTPETVAPVQPRPRYRPQRTSVPPHARREFYAAAIAALITFAVFGLFTSLAPVVLRSLRVASPALAGLAAFLVFGSAALTQILLSHWAPRRQLLVGLLGLAVGMIVVTAAVWVANLALFLLGGAIAGAAAGTTFKGGVTTVLSLAVPDRRGETLTGLFLAAYLGVAIPALGVGLAVEIMAVRDAVLVFVGVLLVATAFVARRFVTRGPQLSMFS
jgi:MFS family permease